MLKLTLYWCFVQITFLARNPLSCSHYARSAAFDR